MGGNPGLRPLSFGEILDVALKIFGRHWRTLVACVLVPTIPIQIVSVLVILSIAPEDEGAQQPPAMAGRMTSVSPSLTEVPRPSRTRTSSSLR